MISFLKITDCLHYHLHVPYMYVHVHTHLQSLWCLVATINYLGDAVPNAGRSRSKLRV